MIQILVIGRIYICKPNKLVFTSLQYSQYIKKNWCIIIKKNRIVKIIVFFFSKRHKMDNAIRGPSWSYASWIYKYLCNQCLSPLRLWVQIPLMTNCTQYNIMWWSLSVTCIRSVVFSSFLHQQNWLPWYNWNIVESGIKHHNPNPNNVVSYLCDEVTQV